MKAKIRFLVHSDKMSASMLVGRPSEDYTVTMDEVNAALEEEGIKYGICTEKLENAIENQSFLSEIPCAKGLPPVAGTDGEISFVVPVNTELKPRIKDDGTADYHDLGLINEIDEGRLLCRRTKPIPGTDGMDVYGNVIPYKAGKYPDFPAGEGTKISSFDDTKLVASRNGYIKFENGELSIPDVFVLNSDVDNGTGNIVFRGDVVINGSVREGFIIKSGKNVKINGSVEGAHIISGGNVYIRDGFTGMEEGDISASGDVESRYIQNAVVKCGGNVTSEYLLNSYITSGGEINVSKGRGAIAGGETRSVGSINANYLGSDIYVETKLVIDDLPENFWSPSFVPYTHENDEDDDDIDEIPMIKVLPDAKISARSCAYPEVKIQIGMSFFDVDRELKCTRFEVAEGEISAKPIL